MLILLRSASGAAPSATGTLDATEAQDSAAVAASLTFSGAFAANEGVQDSVSISGVMQALGTIAASETQDTATAAGASRASGSLAATETQDSAISSASMAIVGTFGEVVGRVGSSNKSKRGFDETGPRFSSSAIKFDATTLSEGQDTASMAGTVANPAVAGTLAASDAQDEATIAATLTFAGQFAANEGYQDTVTLAGTIRATGLLVATDAPDEAAIEAAAAFAGTLAANDPPDTASLGGATASLGSLEATEEADQFAATAGLRASGTMDAPEAADDATASGTGAVTGGLSAIEEPDGASFDESSVTAGLLAVIEPVDAVDLVGVVEASVEPEPVPVRYLPMGGASVQLMPRLRVGVLAFLEASDSVTIAGSLASEGILEGQEPGDRATFGLALLASGPFDLVEQPDTAEMTGTANDWREYDNAFLLMAA